MNTKLLTIRSSVCGIAVALLLQGCGGGGGGGGSNQQPVPTPLEGMQVADVHAGTRLQSRYQSSGVEFAGRFFFPSTDAEHGSELWVTDGTPANTALFLDLLPGSQGSGPRHLLVVARRLYFVARSEAGVVLFVSDGTTAGTKQVSTSTAALPTVSSSLLVIGNQVWFTGRTPSHGFELWVCLGEEMRLVKDLEPGPESSLPNLKADLNGKCLFSASTEDQGREWWLSDGTESGTFMLADFNPAGDGDGAGVAEVVNGLAILTGETPEHGEEIFVSDGTVGGTELLVDLRPGSVGSNLRILMAADKFVYFMAFDDSKGYSLFRTDGTAAGTVLLRATGGTRFFEVGVVYDRPLFRFNDGISGWELWTSDGTEAGTKLVTDIDKGPGNGMPQLVGYSVTGEAYISAQAAATGRELYVTDGTRGGTRLIHDFLPGTGGSSPQGYGLLGSVFFVGASDENYVVDLYTVSGDVVTPLPQSSTVGQDSWPTGFATVDGVTYFSASTQEHGRELHRVAETTGAGAGARTVLDVSPGRGASHPGAVVGLNSKIVFSATDADLGRELHVSDGTLAGTSVIDLNPGSESSNPSRGIVFGGLLFFTATLEGVGREPFVTDGTASGTRLLKDLDAAGSSSPFGWNVVGGRLLFFGTTGNGSRKLFRTDGTEAGTEMVVDFNLGVTDSLRVVDSTQSGWFLSIRRDAEEAVLHFTDGTVAGTRIVAALPEGAWTGAFARLGDDIFVAVDTGLWRVAPTGQTTLVLKIAEIETLQPAAGKLWFLGSTAETGAELWVSDGTSTGTKIVADLNPGPMGAGITDLTAFDGQLWLVGYEPVHGRELRRVNDSGEIELVRDLWPGPANGCSGEVGSRLFVTEDALFLQGDDGKTGVEPWRFEKRAR